MGAMVPINYGTWLRSEITE